MTSPRPDSAGDAITGSERLARLRLALSDNVGPATWHQLVSHYGSAEAAIEILPELASRAGAGRRVRLYPADRAERDLELTSKANGQLITFGEPAYPYMLAEAGQPPPVLFAAGNIELLNSPCCAIVGSRNASANGRRFAREVSFALGQAGWTVVSGLARGIDTAAHEAALAAGTVAVMATGLDVIYPAENGGLAARISDGGCLVTEMPPGTHPRAELFPRRNRIIAGLSAGLAVIEAALRSGSLITARLANEMGREVFAMPGSPYDPRSQGTNRLIQDGASLLGAAGEIAMLLPGHSARMRPGPETAIVVAALVSPGSSADGISETTRQTVLELLGPDPVETDLLIRESGLSLRQVQEILIELDLAGRLERHPGQRVSIVG
ncbi:MAG: DNA-processing protein DprA [Anderseniella sp.]|nr:DNA-processing protein DprA [Anderseniella sp.]